MILKTYQVTFRNRGGQRIEVHVDAVDVRNAVNGVALRPDCAQVVKAVPVNG